MDQDKQVAAASAPEEAKGDKVEQHKKSKFREILRFAIIGVLCTIIDFGIQFVLLKYVFANNISQIEGWGNYVAFAISVTIAFIVANIVNFVFSRTFVFQNVDKSVNTKTQKAWWTYFFLGAGGWLLGLALQELGVWICQLGWNMTLSYDITKVSWTDLATTGGWPFYAFLIIFCIKTLVTMVYNYETRKHLIFKAPKEEPSAPSEIAKPVVASASGELTVETEVAPVSPVDAKYDAAAATAGKEQAVTVAPAEEANLGDKHVTPERFQAILHEELNAYMGPGYVKQSEAKTRAEIQKAIQDYEAEEKAKQSQGK
jgi:putative flippase GtrA